MRVDEFDFDLPEDRIALRPAVPRDAARLMVVHSGGAIEDHVVRELPDILAPADVLVRNDTRVIPAQLRGERRRQGNAVPVAATLVEHVRGGVWWTFLKPGRRVRTGDRLEFSGAASKTVLEAVVLAKAGDGRIRIDFRCDRPTLEARLAEIGQPPLPPYIAARRRADARDTIDYQTVFAAKDGAIAAPTAGLHFTQALMDDLADRGVGFADVTLHVGVGTFLPVKVADTRDHVMHAEVGTISAETAERLNAARAAGGRIVAVGTTSLRLLESAADKDGRIHPFSGETSIFITPGYRFRAVDILMTNFHLPKSTLFMLVSAFSGTNVMKAAYRHAVAEGYRFYSYGDACLLMRGEAA